MEQTCKKCNSPAKESTALLNGWVSTNDFGNDASRRGTTMFRRSDKVDMTKCLKCTKCGHSWIP